MLHAQVIEPNEIYPYFLAEFTAAGGLSGEGSSNHQLWSWRHVDAQHFFSDVQAGALPAGSVVFLDSAAVFKADPRNSTMGDDGIDGSSALVWALRSPRLWALLNHPEPLIIFFHQDNNCEFDWPRTTHHVVYRTVWCDRYHREWRVSQAAERWEGPQAGWLRSVPFGINFNLREGGMATLGAHILPATQRRLLCSFRGSLSNVKPSRKLLVEAAQDATVRAKLEAVAAKFVGHTPPHPSGIGRLLIETRIDPFPYSKYPTSDRITYLELLRESVFSISPPGDLWEAYRTYEAIEAGSIPVVAANETYKKCSHPERHLLETVPGAVAVHTWEELPYVLAFAAQTMSQRQKAMLGWLREEKQRTHDELLQTAALMSLGNGSWRDKTMCSLDPLQPKLLATQRTGLASYWRNSDGQPYKPTSWTTQVYLATYEAKRLKGQGGMCETVKAQGEEDFSESQCFTEVCHPPLVQDLACGVRPRSAAARHGLFL